MNRRALVTLTGTTPLLLHRNNPDVEDVIKKWRKYPENKELSVAGDDRCPAWTWQKSLYHDGRVITLPSDNLMTMLREGGAKVPAGKRGTLKRATQSGILVLLPNWPLIPAGRSEPIEIAPLMSLIGNNDYEAHCQAAKDAGFELQCKGVRVNRARHLRVRPMFAAGWSLSGEMVVTDDSITDDAFCHVLRHAGAYAGLGDWRPSSPMAPGPYGQFTADVKWLK